MVNRQGIVGRGWLATELAERNLFAQLVADRLPLTAVTTFGGCSAGGWLYVRLRVLFTSGRVAERTTVEARPLQHRH